MKDAIKQSYPAVASRNHGDDYHDKIFIEVQ